MKLAEYMALGIPTVAYAQGPTQVLTEAGAGIVVQSPRDFVGAVATLEADEMRRRTLAEAARSAGAELDVRTVTRRYEREVLDRYLA